MTGRLYIDIETCNVSGHQRNVARPFMKIPAADKKLTLAEVKEEMARIELEEGIKQHEIPDERLIGMRQELLKAKAFAAQDAALDQTALNGLWGEVVAIGYAPDDKKVFCDFRDFDEQELLVRFGDRINGYCDVVWHKSSPCIIGHNVQFDIRFLWQRYVVNGLTPPHWLTRALHAKPWDDEKVFDTMVQWCGLREYVSLGALYAGLGIEVPKTIDGSEVPQAWLDGRYDEIRAHVLADVEAVRAVHRRMRVT